MAQEKAREKIETFIRQWDGTILGYQVKNMLDNGTDLETICEATGIEYEED